jgi:hypothetical protein
MSDLTDRMRTCAAYIMSRPNDAPMPTEHLLDDAADLLIAASNALETEDLGEPMEIIPPQTAPRMEAPSFPSASRACPRCGTHTANTVRREGRRLLLLCPACGNEWEFKPTAKWV